MKSLTFKTLIFSYCASFVFSQCPIMTCDPNDVTMQKYCFFVQQASNGAIAYMKTNGCGSYCGLTDGYFVWLETALQFKAYNEPSSQLTVEDSQFYGKTSTGTCF